MTPDIEFELAIGGINVIPELPSLGHRRSVRTKRTPETGYTPLPRGPQNLLATATATTITVTWDSPHPGANDYHHVHLHHRNRATAIRTSVHQPP